MDDPTLLEGPIGHLRADDVLQLAARLPEAVRVRFETEDRATGAPWCVELGIESGRLVGLGVGAGLRLGDLAVGRGFLSRPALEALAQGAGSRLGMRLLEAGVLDAGELDDLLWERHARVVWSLLAWDHGHFRASIATPESSSLVAVDPPLAIEALLLDGLQRAESAAGRSR